MLGDPAAAVAWLANALARYGTGIEAGQFVMSGSYTTASFVVRRRPCVGNYQRPRRRHRELSTSEGADS